ncbi:MAG: hypothetical protein AAF847_00200 [Bacteroidota bacterium]
MKIRYLLSTLLVLAIAVLGGNIFDHLQPSVNALPFFARLAFNIFYLFLSAGIACLTIILSFPHEK